MSPIRILPVLLAVLAPLVACGVGSSENVATGAPQALTECDLGGSWAIKVTTPVKWNASFVLQAGQGNVTNWLKTTRTVDGLTVTDTAQICGIETPDYTATPLFGAEHYGIRFADAVFATLPTFQLTGTVSAKTPGATFNAPPSAALVGATLANPLTDAWPAVANIAAVDVDGDGKPGISGDSASGTGFSNPPVNPTRTVRANRLYATFRQVLDASNGTLTSCDRVDGTAKTMVIANKPAVDSHVLGCRHDTDGADCGASEWKLLDTAAPVYVPTGDAVLTMVRLPAGAAASCADVRAIDFSAPSAADASAPEPLPATDASVASGD